MSGNRKVVARQQDDVFVNARIIQYSFRTVAYDIQRGLYPVVTGYPEMNHVPGIHVFVSYIARAVSVLFRLVIKPLVYVDMQFQVSKFGMARRNSHFQ
ncbi:hypothetical protein SDC9_178551 [bioreactor metagenome]|uniref:Uncharacterized protein n=1 Tax=bioreactor metagenome TaxID=1076179 RepID=A0A645GWK5_9ZZZZ